jgi:23S rRNA pseudouridine2605 synthase
LPRNGGRCRLNKTIAAAGICSRREADTLIKSGQVTVNGVAVINLATLVDPEKDVVLVRGKPLPTKKLIYVALHKPKGVITSCEDEKNRRCVLDLLPPELKHLKPVGRLDRDSSGLLILTNDGAFIYALTHPSQEVGKTYAVTVSGPLKTSQLGQLSNGLMLADGKTYPAEIRIVARGEKESCFEMTIHEGRNRQIRRMCSQVGLSVTKLTRVAIGGLQLKGLKPGTWRVLSEAEVKKLGTAQKQRFVQNSY